MSRWFKIGVKPNTNASALVLESEAKLPVEMAIERERRAAQIKPAKFDLKSLPQVRLPYRMWRAPALDFVVSAGVTYRASDGVRVDRSSSVYAAGEIARLSYDAQLSTNEKGIPNTLRLRAYRSDPDAQLLGPLKATHFGVGDVSGLVSGLAGSGASGRGAVVTNRPLFNPTAFDKTRFEGDLPVGWEAELYRNGELLAFARPSGNSRYTFEDVQLLYGENRISIVLYGPQGQIRTREEMINVGQDNVPAGKTWYWAGVNQPGRDIVSFRQSPEALTMPKAQAAVSVEHGIDDRTSVGAIARAMLIQDERVTFVEGSVRRSIGPALVEAGIAWESGGGKAARAQVLAKFGTVNVSGQAILADNFHLQGQLRKTVRDYKLAVDAPVQHRTDERLGTFRCAAYPAGGQFEPARGRGTAFDHHPPLQSRDRRSISQAVPRAWALAARRGRGRSDGLGCASAMSGCEASAAWKSLPRPDSVRPSSAPIGPRANLSIGRGRSHTTLPSKRARARVSHIRRINTMALAVTGEAASDGSVAVGLNLNFSLDPNHGLSLSRQPLAAAGAVRARVYRDRNDNGVHDSSEPWEKGALVTTGSRVTEKPTDDRGSILIGGLTTFTPLAVGIDASSLPDPNVVPKKALQVVVPRPGVPVEVEIGLVGGGEIEGAVVKSGGLGFEGLKLELLDEAGKVVATAQSDYDGYFLFERVAYGRYTVRVGAESATAAKIAQELRVTAEVNEDRSVARLGSIQVTKLPTVASSQ